jgi:hypothetical protein
MLDFLASFGSGRELSPVPAGRPASVGPASAPPMAPPEPSPTDWTFAATSVWDAAGRRDMDLWLSCSGHRRHQDQELPAHPFLFSGMFGVTRVSNAVGDRAVLQRVRGYPAYP